MSPRLTRETEQRGVGAGRQTGSDDDDDDGLGVGRRTKGEVEAVGMNG